MNARHSFYRDIHKGIRVMLFDLIEKSGRLDVTDAQALAMYRSELTCAIELLEDHAHHENEFVAPLLEKASPELAKLIGGNHVDQEQQLADLVARLAAIDSKAADARQQGHAFVVQLSRVVGELLTHMADEEELIMPALWSILDDAELMKVHQALVASITPDKFTRSATWMLPAMNRHERLEVLFGVRMTMPAQAFAFVRELASSVLSPDDDAALTAALESMALVVA